MAPCPYCKNPLATGLRHCEACKLQLAHDQNGQLRPWFPPIRAGELVASLDFRRDPLPGRKDRQPFDYKDGSKRRPTPYGMELFTPTQGHFEFILNYLRIRDVVVRAQVVILSPGIEVFVGARYQNLDSMDLGYRFMIRPDRGQYRLVRIAASTKVGSSDVLHGPAHHPQVAAALGRPIVIEIGVQGPTLQASIDGLPAWSVHDPVLGTGCPAIGGGMGDKGEGAMLFQWMEVRAVVP